MSKNAKNTRKIKDARARKMKKGPASTKKLNTKKNVWWRKGRQAPNTKSNDGEQNA